MGDNADIETREVILRYVFPDGREEIVTKIVPASVFRFDGMTDDQAAEALMAVTRAIAGQHDGQA